MADSSKPRLFLLRHGETQWSRSGQHTGRTDLPLTEAGREAARRLRSPLARRSFALVLCSPLQRARQTCDEAGLLERAEFDPDLMEWDYGRYEGLTTPQIQEEVPGWNVFEHGSPGGDSPADVAARVDRVIARIVDLPGPGAGPGDVAIFAHGHLLRVFAARWMDQPASFGPAPAAGHRHDLRPRPLPRGHPRHPHMERPAGHRRLTVSEPGCPQPDRGAAAFSDPDTLPRGCAATGAGTTRI